MSLKIPPALLIGIALAITLLVVAVALLLLARWSGRMPSPSALVGGHLRPCTAAPNCVSSEAGTDDAHRVEALPLGPDGSSLDALLAAVAVAARAEAGCEHVPGPGPDGGYLHFVFRTRLLGFADDLELRIDEPAGVVHVRSGSRVGHSDLGANRARVERLRAAYLAELNGV